jgi:asparagine synthase (glutamine-hydrolysing)
MFAGIRELEPGFQLTVNLGSGAVEVKSYWDLRYAYNASRTDEQTADELFALVDDAVAIHCRSDAPLGCHLSGGIDSSAVVGFAARHRPKTETFSIKFSDDAHIDETGYAKAVARHVNAVYRESSPTATDLAELLPYLVWHMDMPMVSDGAFGYFMVSEFAKRHVKVSLTGHGGDEVFAGYPAQFQAAFNTTAMFRLHADPDRQPRRPGLLRRALRRGPHGLYRALRARAAAAAGTRSLEDTWVALHCDGLPADNPLLHVDFVRQLRGYSPRDQYVAPLTSAPTDQILDRCLYHDLRVYLPSLLHLEDRLSMAVSLESRVPLLDHRIVEFLATVPPESKVAGLRPKHLLRQVSARLLPEEIWRNRDKRGFPVPGSFWRARRLADTVKQVLLSKRCMERGIFSVEALRRACDDPGGTTGLWPLLNVELWFRIFIDRDPVWVDKVEGTRASLVRS